MITIATRLSNSSCCDAAAAAFFALTVEVAVVAMIWSAPGKYYFDYATINCATAFPQGNTQNIRNLKICCNYPNRDKKPSKTFQFLAFRTVDSPQSWGRTFP
ncbi:hypothetical protein LP419_37110 [Massilia sp. H-1]|nr:hypothetical protein LP419_37110 [Massilia sp. H-1]